VPSVFPSRQPNTPAYGSDDSHRQTPVSTDPLEHNLLHDAVARHFDRVGLPSSEEFSRRYPHQLSGGQQQRVSIALALSCDPAVIVLDEPTTGLDPQARHLIWERMRELTAGGKTLVLTTHFMDEAERLCNRLAIMDAGRVIAQGAPRDLIARHIEPQVVEVYGDGVKEWAAQHGRTLAGRLELSGDTAFCYAEQADALVASLHREGRLRYLHRPANLEDVFLKLTGRELRD